MWHVVVCGLWYSGMWYGGTVAGIVVWWYGGIVVLLYDGIVVCDIIPPYKHTSILFYYHTSILKTIF